METYLTLVKSALGWKFSASWLWDPIELLLHIIKWSASCSLQTGRALSLQLLECISFGAVKFRHVRNKRGSHCGGG